MVGRTPEYLGKKIESYEMKMASLILLIPIFTALGGTAIGVLSPAGQAGVFNPGPHGYTEILYAFSSATANNGSAFAGLSVNTPFYNTALGVIMFFARYWLAIPALAIGGSLARKKKVPSWRGNFADPYAAVYCMDNRGRHYRWRAWIFTRIGIRPNRRTFDDLCSLEWI